MLDHLIVPVSDINKSKQFYSEILGALNYEQKNDFGTSVSFGSTDDSASSFWLSEGEPSPVHLAFVAHSREEVDHFFKTALVLGGKSNGEPGLREYGPGYYATFIHDLDGYNIEAVYHEK